MLSFLLWRIFNECIIKLTSADFRPKDTDVGTFVEEVEMVLKLEDKNKRDRGQVVVNVWGSRRTAKINFDGCAFCIEGRQDVANLLHLLVCSDNIFLLYRKAEGSIGNNYYLYKKLNTQ